MAHLIVLWIVIVFLGVVGLLHLGGGKAIREAYVGWRYPKNFHLVTGLLEVAAAGLMIFASTRVYGLKLAVVITVAAILTLLWHRQFSHLIAPLVLAAGIGYLLF
ncbi:hypothetical protein [Sphingomonas sp.]|uniref:hypothetical protein n=1 Tax=Sphingomonas sp. TaxID=28214 RepID=UPI003D6CF41A